MTITLKAQNVMDFFTLREKLGAMKMPLKGAYKINKIVKEVNEFAEVFQGRFNEIVEKYAVKKENGEYEYIDEEQTQVRIQPDKLVECNDEITKLLTEQVEIDNQNLKIDDLGEDFECTPAEFEVISNFVVDEDEE